MKQADASLHPSEDLLDCYVRFDSLLPIDLRVCFVRLLAAQIVICLLCRHPDFIDYSHLVIIGYRYLAVTNMYFVAIDIIQVTVINGW